MTVRMETVAVGTTPVNLRQALNLPASPAGAQPRWYGRIQNAGPAAVFRTIAESSPDPAAVVGWRHPVGDVFTLGVRVGPGAKDVWVWTARDGATLIFEAAH